MRTILAAFCLLFVMSCGDCCKAQQAPLVVQPSLPPVVVVPQPLQVTVQPHPAPIVTVPAQPVPQPNQRLSERIQPPQPDLVQPSPIVTQPPAVITPPVVVQPPVVVAPTYGWVWIGSRWHWRPYRNQYRGRVWNFPSR